MTERNDNIRTLAACANKNCQAHTHRIVDESSQYHDTCQHEQYNGELQQRHLAPPARAACTCVNVRLSGIRRIHVLKHERAELGKSSRRGWGVCGMTHNLLASSPICFAPLEADLLGHAEVRGNHIT